MPLTPFPVGEFGGLNLAVDPIEVGMSGGVDLSNVDFDRPGRLRTRDGNTLVKSLGSNAISGGIAAYSSGATAVPQLIVIYETNGAVWKMDAYAATGGAAVATATPGAQEVFAVPWGDSSNTRLYIADLTGMWRWNGATFTQLAALTTNSKFLALSTRDNRLVRANVSGGGNPSRVWFSDAGAPETFGATNWVDVTPGDGSDINGATSFQGDVYVFKAERYFRFYSTSTLSDGSAVFNYQTVERHGSLIPPAAGQEGVYFFDGRYVWLTDASGRPRRISTLIEPFLQGKVSVNGVTGTPGFGVERLAYSNGRLYFTAVTTASGNRSTLVYDPKTDTWTFYSIAGSGFVQAPNGVTVGKNDPTTFWLTSDASALKILRVDATATTDDGTAITWSYQTGYSSAGGYFRQRIISSGERKRHHHVDILGSGTVTHQVLTLNPRSADIADPGGSVTLGTAPALARGYRRRGARGTHIAHKLSGSGPAVVSGFTYWLANVGSDT